MPRHSLRTILTLAASLTAFSLRAADTAPTWLPPHVAGVTADVQSDGSWQLSSALNTDYTIESSQMLPAKPGDSFAIKVRAQVGIDMNALPELVCYDAQGREIPVPSSLLRANRFATTNWQTAELWYDVQAPAQINLTCDCNAVAFGHGSALYRRNARAHLAHRVVKIVLSAPTGTDADKTQ